MAANYVTVVTCSVEVVFEPAMLGSLRSIPADAAPLILRITRPDYLPPLNVEISCRPLVIFALAVAPVLTVRWLVMHGTLRWTGSTETKASRN